MKHSAMESRTARAKMNVVASFVCQILTIICGLVVPRVLIGAFGSEAYGATSSITQFLAYITLLEGGIGGVARAALYQPLAENNLDGISAVTNEIRGFFRIVGYVFAGYVLVLACTFQRISNPESLDWLSSFVLVIVISISTFGQYFIGISNSVLLQAAQKSYVTNLVSIGATLINAILVVVSVGLGCSLIAVKLLSSLVFFLRPVVLWLYVNRHYQLRRSKARAERVLKQKWDGLGQHIAFFLHTNTDVVLLTCFTNLKLVAVYSVYNMVITQIQNLTASFAAGMEAMFGDMLARREYDELHEAFGKYETILSVVGMVLFSTTAVLIVPFVKLYTANITDVNYEAPVFAVLLLIAGLLYCLRMPYHSMVIAAGHFRQTSIAAYGETILNVGVSLVLISRLELIGVAIGTVLAVSFRFVFYAVYLSRHIFCRKIGLFLKRMLVNAAAFICIGFCGHAIVSRMLIDTFFAWIFAGVCVVALALVVTCGMNGLFYWKQLRQIVKKRS